MTEHNFPESFFERRRLWASAWAVAAVVSASSWAGAARAWTRPALPGPDGATEATPAEGRLESMVITVNGEPRLVPAGAEITVFHGDVLEARDATLADHAKAPRTVDVIGLPDHPGAAKTGGDRGRAFNTTELLARHSLDGAGEVFAVVAHTKKIRHGLVYVRLVDPVLRWAEVEINGAARVVRDGEPLSLRAADLLKIGRVTTSLAGRGTEPGDVLVTVVPIGASGGDGNAGAGKTRFFEIRFARAGREFAMIPLVVRE
jgi:hypothetical protein